MQFLGSPKVRFTSRSTDFLKSRALRGIVSLGPAAIPLIVEKLPKQRFLHYALAQITGIDLRREVPDALSERDVAQLWINWWKTGKAVFTRSVVTLRSAVSSAAIAPSRGAERTGTPIESHKSL